MSTEKPEKHTTEEARQAEAHDQKGLIVGIAIGAAIGAVAYMVI